VNGHTWHLIGSLVGAIVVVPIASLASWVTQEHRTMAVTWVKVRDHGVVHHVHWHVVLVWPLGTDLDVTGHRNCSCWVHRVANRWEWLGFGNPSLGLYLGLYVSHATRSRVARHVRKLKDGGG